MMELSERKLVLLLGETSFRITVLEGIVGKTERPREVVGHAGRPAGVGQELSSVLTSRAPSSESLDGRWTLACHALCRHVRSRTPYAVLTS
jgi:hypothetical protein